MKQVLLFLKIVSLFTLIYIGYNLLFTLVSGQNSLSWGSAISFILITSSFSAYGYMTKTVEVEVSSGYDFKEILLEVLKKMKYKRIMDNHNSLIIKPRLNELGLQSKMIIRLNQTSISITGARNRVDKIIKKALNKN